MNLVNLQANRIYQRDHLMNDSMAMFTFAFGFSMGVSVARFFFNAHRPHLTTLLFGRHPGHLCGQSG